jgi:ectoine hydroxylase-related dioxygenase (phytanoyl-CoA dioxygenase family)
MGHHTPSLNAMPRAIETFPCTPQGTLVRPAAELARAVEANGCVILRGCAPPPLVGRLRDALVKAVAEDEARHGPGYLFKGMVHALVTRGPAFLEFLELSSVRESMKALLGHGCIVHAFNSSSMPPGGTNYSRSVHVDSPRLIPGYLTNVGLCMALDPFTAANGGMEIAPKSFTQSTAPAEPEFEKAREVLDDLAPGDAIVFNARCWHRGGQNTTSSWRHAVTINVCRSFMRQQFDFPRMLERAGMKIGSESLRQFLGGHVVMPTGMDEFLLPADQRPYRPGQE